jgi:predicted dehydrogenase
MGIKLGVIGAGHLGKIHLKCLSQTDFDLVGVYDIDPGVRDLVEETYGVDVYDDVSDLLAVVDAVDIVTPTVTHYALAQQAIAAGKHIFVEKPVTLALDEARALDALVSDSNLIAQVGHVERYNPALLALGDRPLQPVFIEGHRLATFNPRGTDVSVVLDLMIHDLDLVLSIVDSEVVDVRASGVAIVSPTYDICNARIEFDNGCVANLTASRISLKAMRKIRLFQADAYISINMLDKNSQVVQLDDLPDGVDHDTFDGMVLPTIDGHKRLTIEAPPMVENNAIVSELNDFYKAIATGKQPPVTLRDGYKALQLAHQIQSSISTRP